MTTRNPPPDTKRPPKRYQVSIRREVFERIQAHANRQGVTISDVVEALTSDIGKGE